MSRKNFVLTAALITALVIALSLALRWNAIAYDVPLNVDEAEILAAGRRAAIRPWMPMETASANTYFVLWPTLLGLLNVLGVPLTFHAAHAMSAAAYGAMVSMMWIATARRWGWLWSGSFVLPAAYWLLISYTDYMQLGTEVPSALLLVLGAMLAFPPGKVITGRRLALVAAIASVAPWFKPQSGPLAVTLVISAFVFAYATREAAWSRGELIRKTVWLLVGALGPTLALVGLMLVGGTLDLFWNEPVSILWAYTNHSITDGNGAGGSTAPLGTKVAHIALLLKVNLLSLGWAALGLRGVWLCRREPPMRLAILSALWLAPLAAAMATLLVSWPIYVHYVNFLYAGTAMAGIAGSGLTSRRAPLPTPRARSADKSRLMGLATFMAVTASLTAIFLLYGTRTFTKPPAGAGLFATAGAHRGEGVLTKECPSGDPVYVWGWAAELYAYYDWQPASRYVTYGLPLATTPHRDQFRSRLLNELETDPPTCIINAVGPNWFGPTSADMTLEKVIPASKEWLERCYAPRIVTFSPGDSVPLWTKLPGC